MIKNIRYTHPSEYTERRDQNIYTRITESIHIEFEIEAKKDGYKSLSDLLYELIKAYLYEKKQKTGKGHLVGKISEDIAKYKVFE